MPTTIVIKIHGENKVDPETPELGSGDKIDWHNTTEEAYIIEFTAPSPFEGGAIKFNIQPEGFVVSEPIKPGTGSFKYQVRQTQRPKVFREKAFGPPGPLSDPTIVVK